MTKQFLITISLLLITIFSFSATITVINTNNTGTGSLRNAISTSSSNDTIRFDPALIASGSNTILLTSHIAFNKGLTIIGLYNTTDTLFISGGNTNRAFSIGTTNSLFNDSLFIDSITVINGKAQYTGGILGGGAIYSFMTANGYISINNSIFKNNTSSQTGGAIFIRSSSGNIKISNTYFEDNTAVNGAAIHSMYSDLDIDNCIFYSNITTNGGIVGVSAHTNPVSFNLTSSTFKSNTNNNGTIYGEAINASLILNVSSSTFISNTGLSASVLKFVNIGSSTISSNIENSTFYNNSNTAFNASVSPVNFNVKGSIFYNSNFNSGSNVNMISQGYNIFSNAPIGTIANDLTNITSAQLNLGPLAFNGGKTPTLLPFTGSVALNNGDPTDLSNAQNGAIVGVRDRGAAESAIISSFVWSGATGSDWFTATNWVSGTVPTSTDSVFIPSTVPNFPLITPSTTIGNMEVATGASLTIVTGIVLNGTLTNNGTVTLQNGAYLDDFTNAGASFVGNITVETLTANGLGDDQRLISSPINNAPISEIVDDLNGPWGAGAQGTNGVAITVDDCTIPTLISNSNYGNLFEFNETLVNTSACGLDGWVVRSSGNLENGRGYSAYLTTNTTFDFTGTPNTGSVSVAVTNSASGVADAEGWNLIGNPYPSALSRDAVITAGASDVQYFVTSGVYQGTYSPYLPTSSIAIAQGVQAHFNNSTTLNIDNTMRVATAATWYQNENWFTHKLGISVLGNGKADKTILFYNNEATASYEPMYDVVKRNSDSGYPTLSTFGGNKSLSLNGKSVNDLGEIVPLNLNSGSNGSFTLSFEGLETFGKTTIYIKDLLTNTVHNISNGDYTFSANENDNAERFEIIFIREISFTTTKVDCNGNLGSIFSTMQNNLVQNRTFELSTNGFTTTNDLINLGQKLAEGNYSLTIFDQYGGNQVYHFSIETKEQIVAAFTISNTKIQVGESFNLLLETQNGTNYNWNFGDGNILSNITNLSYAYPEEGVYELVLDISNKECSDSKKILITVSNKTTGITTIDNIVITVYPNPVKDILFIDSTEDLHFELINNLGTVIIKTTSNNINVEKIPSGIYFLNIYNKNKDLIAIQKIMKK